MALLTLLVSAGSRLAAQQPPVVATGNQPPAAIEAQPKKAAIAKKQAPRKPAVKSAPPKSGAKTGAKRPISKKSRPRAAVARVTGRPAPGPTPQPAPKTKPVIGPAEPALEAPTMEIQVSELGYRDGIVMEADQYMHTLFFALPKDVRFTGGLLRLNYRASPMLTAPSNMRLTINGVPRTVLPLGGTPEAVVTVPIAVEDLAKRFVEVRIQAGFVLSSNLCLDERSRGGYLHVTPDSGLKLWMTSSASASIRGYWAMLPEAVTVSVSAGPLDEEAFVAAWALGTGLTRRGKQVRFARLPEIGHVVVTNRKEATALLGGSQEPGGNIALLSRDRRPFLWIGEPYHQGTASLLENPWVELASVDRYLLRPIGDTRAPEATPRFAVRLSDLGVRDALRMVRTSGEWGFYVHARQLPPRYRPRLLMLNLVSSPSRSDQPVTLSVYMNDWLVQSLRLADDGKVQQFVVHIPAETIRTDNRFRIVVQRVDSEGNCEKGGLWATYPVQLLPDSALLAEHDDEPPEMLSQFVSALGDDFHTLVPRSYRDDPTRPLEFLSRLSVALGVTYPQAKKVRFYAPAELLKIDGSFLAVGKARLSGFSTPVRFDRGSIQVTEPGGRILLDVDRLPGVTITQLCRDGRLRGLWVMAPESGPIPKLEKIAGADGDVLFLDHTGELMTLDSRKKDLARIINPGIKGWLEILGAYRYWLIATAWLAFTIVFIRFYRKTQKGKTA